MYADGTIANFFNVLLQQHTPSHRLHHACGSLIVNFYDAYNIFMCIYNKLLVTYIYRTFSFGLCILV